MNKYIFIENYEYENFDFYYQLDNNYYFKPWNRPSDEKLNNLLQYFYLNYSKSELFNIYLTGRFNSNQKEYTWDIDLIVCFKDINDKDYQNIYDCLFFLYDNALKKFSLLVDITYSDNIISFGTDFLNKILSLDISISDNYIKNLRQCQGEQILIFKKFIKKSKTNSFCQILNEKIYKEIDINGKKLYIINNDISYEKMIEKKIKYIKSGCVYYGRKLINIELT